VGVADFALVAAAEGDDAEYVLDIELIGNEVIGQRRVYVWKNAIAKLANFIDRLTEAAAHHAGPRTIDKGLGKPRILRTHDPVGQLRSASNIAPPKIHFAVRKRDRL